MSGTVIVTGATSGIGFAVAGSLLAQGFRVIGIGHHPHNCAQAAAQLAAKYGSSSVKFLTADLMQQREVHRVADELARDLESQSAGSLHALILNAGCVRSWYATTEEGYEQQFALNHLSGFLLTYRLLPYLRRAGGRVILTGSGSHKHQKIHWQDVMLKDCYQPLRAYKQSKLCNMLFALELNRRFQNDGIQAFVVDPGLVRTDIGNKETGSLVNFIWNFRKRGGQAPEVPAQTFTYLCEQKEPLSGLYFHDRRARNYSKTVTADNARRLFSLSEQLCSIAFGGAQ